MERREFLGSLTIAPGCALAASKDEGAEGPENSSAQAENRYGVKITVLRRGFEKEIIDQFKNGPKSSCTRLNDGQEFTVKS